MSLFFIFSCSYTSYKEDVTSQINQLILELKEGNLNVIPGFSEVANSLDDETIKKVKKAYSSLELGTIEVDKISENGIVNVTAFVTIEGNDKDLLFQFKKTEGEWQLLDKIILTKDISVVPADK